tara:strand:+ start:18319 stop:18879 length:561 start_codon:yes stop_codon:yes gene_type:complete
MGLILLLFLNYFYQIGFCSSVCICTTVPCPQEGNNLVIMGKGYANITYTYHVHNNYEVVINAKGTIYKSSLDKGTDTTSCTQKYSRMLEDDGQNDCDAGHILANRLGGYGNLPVNIFPQNSSMNRGTYAQFEGEIYDCMLETNGLAYLSWDFFYENKNNTMPYKVIYSANFDDSICSFMQSEFLNK